MKIEDLNLKVLSSTYQRFLKTNNNIGCPMLSSALASVIGGTAISGLFDGNEHCWVLKGNKYYDINNLIGNDLVLIVSSYLVGCYRIKIISPFTLALKLGLTERKFYYWTIRFRKALIEKHGVNNEKI